MILTIRGGGFFFKGSPPIYGLKEYDKSFFKIFLSLVTGIHRTTALKDSVSFFNHGSFVDVKFLNVSIRKWKVVKTNIILN